MVEVLRKDQLLRFEENDGDLTFLVRVVAGASRSVVAGVIDGTLRVRVSAAPVDGLANLELMRTLAEALGVRRRDIEIISGKTSKLKRIRVRNASREVLLQLTMQISPLSYAPSE